MKYRIRPGITLVRICGVSLLIPTRAASQDCPLIMRLSLPVVLVWEGMNKGMPDEKLCQVFQTMLHKTEDEARQFINQVRAGLCEKGYLIAVEEEE